MANEIENYSSSVEDVEKEFSTDLKEGLSQKTAAQRLEKYGPNKLEQKSSVSPWKIFFSQFKNIIMLLLLAATVISFSIGDFVEGIAVVIVILLNALFGFVTEYRAEKSVEALRQMITPTAKVLREGTLSEIDAVNLVPGDIIILEEGDRITADGRLFEADNLAADEAMLTGESEPVNKHTRTISSQKKVGIADRKNMVFMGTAITRGNGKAVVTGTSHNTQMGHISTMLQETEDESTPLEERLEKMGHFLIILTFIVTAVVAVAGILSGKPIIEMLETAIALAIAAVPEGLPAVATITLAIGMKRMAQKNALVKSLPAVETLGSTTVICTDKTGTLTENQMTVQEIFLPGRDIVVSGTGYAPDGKFQEEGSDISPADDDELSLFLKAGSLCSNAVLTHEADKGWGMIGDPTEGALVTAAKKADMDREEMEDTGYERFDELPFDSDAKFMAVLNNIPDADAAVFLKGAPDVVLDMCGKVRVNGSEQELTQEKRETYLQKNNHLAQKGLRVLAVGYKKGVSKSAEIENEIDEGMVFLGFAGILDPPRPDVAQAIKEAQSAGIRTIMITGDQRDTAMAIAQRIDMQGAQGQAITGTEMDEFSIDELAERLRHNPIFARVSPKNKLDIVDALNENNEITAMTGDGVNDAPALKKADIGISMGQRGTTVAKEASDMVLLDDRFPTIVEAVRQGRVIFDNIQKFIHYLFSCNLSEIILIFISILLRVPTPVIALQILWLNLVTDVFPALAMAWETPEAGIMTRPPREPSKPIITNRHKLRIGFQGAVITLGPLFAYLFTLNNGFTMPESRTIGFMTLALVQLFHVFNVRRKNGLGFDITIFKNAYLWGAFVLTLGLQFFAVYTPFMQTILHTTALSPRMWLIVLCGALAPIIVLQIIAGIRVLIGKPYQE
ncbi:MAG: cation-translocating P-type ATPase [Spirochaetia bacterium]